MNKECEKYRELLLELSEIDSLEEDLLPPHILGCDACQSFFKELKQIQKELVDIGNILNKTLPEIDIRDNIKNGVAKIQDGESVVREVVESEHNVPELAEWHSYIENELNEVARYKCELKLEKSDFLKKEIEQIRIIHESLDNIGKLWEGPQLNEDLLPLILRKVEQYKLHQSQSNKFETIEEIEEELCELSSTILTSIKEVDVSSQITEKAKQSKQNIGKREQIEKNLTHVIPLKQSKTKENDIKITKKHPFLNYSIPIAVAAILVFTMLGVYIYAYLGRADYNLLNNKKIASNEKSSENGDYDATQPFYSKAGNMQMDKEAHAKNNRNIESKRGRSNYLEGTLSDWSKQLKDNALANAGKLMRIGVWATLTPQEARELLQKSGLSPEAILGAVQFLPPEEARVVLQSAIDTNPNDAYLRYAMVQTLRNFDNVSEDEIYSQLTAWSDLDPANTLPHIVEAEMYFEKGEMDKAINCITDADNDSNYDSYAKITAKAYMEALLAKGVDPEIAKLLASASAGLREIQIIDEISQTLMEYGKYYEDSGDYNMAFLIYDTLRNLGMKVDMSSELIQERMAGLKHAQEAINAMIQLMNSENSFSDAQSLIDTTQTLSEMMTNYNLALDDFYRLFDTNDPNTIAEILNLYLTSGNTNINVPPPKEHK
ncbi:MAG TPA: hypothetical protein PLX23_03150 [Candidatus Hydrogenedens sp.]|nr:hypothetical protein [Candidatus Hydrogenedens sp.]